MTNLTIDKNNIWKILDNIQKQVLNWWKKIVFSYKTIKENNNKNFLNYFKNNNINFREEPLLLQHKIRNEWK